MQRYVERKKQRENMQPSSRVTLALPSRRIQRSQDSHSEARPFENLNIDSTSQTVFDERSEASKFGNAERSPPISLEHQKPTDAQPADRQDSKSFQVPLPSAMTTTTLTIDQVDYTIVTTIAAESAAN